MVIVAELVKAPGRGPGEWRFKSARSPINRGSSNGRTDGFGPSNVGSIPTPRTIRVSRIVAIASGCRPDPTGTGVRVPPHPLIYLRGVLIWIM